MDFNEYTTMWLIKQRHAEMMEAARRHALLRQLRPPSGRLRLALGTALIRIGSWLLRRQYATGESGCSAGSPGAGGASETRFPARITGTPVSMEPSRNRSLRPPPSWSG